MGLLSHIAASSWPNAAGQPDPEVINSANKDDLLSLLSLCRHTFPPFPFPADGRLPPGWLAPTKNAEPRQPSEWISRLSLLVSCESHVIWAHCFRYIFTTSFPSCIWLIGPTSYGVIEEAWRTTQNNKVNTHNLNISDWLTIDFGLRDALRHQPFITSRW